MSYQSTENHKNKPEEDKFVIYSPKEKKFDSRKRSRPESLEEGPSSSGNSKNSLVDREKEEASTTIEDWTTCLLHSSINKANNMWIKSSLFKDGFGKFFTVFKRELSFIKLEAIFSFFHNDFICAVQCF